MDSDGSLLMRFVREICHFFAKSRREIGCAVLNISSEIVINTAARDAII